MLLEAQLGAPLLSVVETAPAILKSPAHCKKLPLVPDKVLCCGQWCWGFFLTIEWLLTWYRAPVLSLPPGRPSQHTPAHTRRSGTRSRMIRCHCKRGARLNCKRLRSMWCCLWGSRWAAGYEGQVSWNFVVPNCRATGLKLSVRPPQARCLRGRLTK
jgi:hypothetical protein